MSVLLPARRPATVPPGAALDYLCVEAFLQDFASAQALSAAFEIGLVDRLTTAATFQQIADEFSAHPSGLRVLVDLLRGAGVLEECEGNLSLCKDFEGALNFRELLVVKLEFCQLAAKDVASGLASLVQDPKRFMRDAETFRVFDYATAHCADLGPDAVRATERWMRLTTASTRYEAAVFAQRQDFSAHVQMLDIGGNSGEFALQVCRQNPRLRATVFDLPGVCAVGKEHLRDEPEAARIGFQPGDVRRGALPKGFDLITFKSMLHDWPDEQAQQFLGHAAQALEPGGTLVVFERAPLRLLEPAPYGLLPQIMFAHVFRHSELYRGWMERLGLTDVETDSFELDTPFFMVRARKPL